MDRSHTDPSWPVGYPAIVTRDFDLQTPEDPQYAGYISSVRGGDRVKVLTKDNDGFIYIQYPDIVAQDLNSQQNGEKTVGKKGWIDSHILDIGSVRRIGEPLVLNTGDPEVPNVRAPTVPGEGQLLYRTILGLLNSYYENIERLPTYPVYLERRLGTLERRQDFAKRMLKGFGNVSQDLVNLLNTGDFSISDIPELCPDGSEDSRTGIYLILAAEHIDLRPPELYTGSTAVSFEKRMEQHDNARQRTNPKGFHYRSAVSAKVYRMMPVCILTDLDPEHQDLKMAEQVCLDLFETTCDTVLNLKSFDSEPATTEEVSDQPVEKANGELIDRVTKYIIAKEEANILQGLAQQVFAYTGWPGGVRRSLSVGLQPFGASGGLNWTMPLTEMRYCRTTWTMTQVPGKFANFRRTNGRVCKRKGSRQVWNKEWRKGTTGSTSVHSSFYLAENEEGPEFNTPIDVIFEVRLDDQPHPISWARAPTVGCWSDWLDACKVAMRIEWLAPKESTNGEGQEPGEQAEMEWKFRYVQVVTTYNALLEEAPAGATHGYALGKALHAFLTQEYRTPDEEFPWLVNFGIARVKEVYVDHLTQEIRTKDVHAPHPPEVPLAKKSYNELAQELELLGAETVASAEDDKFPPVKFKAAGPPRKSCDHCHAGRKIVRT